MIRKRHRVHLCLVLIGFIASGFASCNRGHTNPTENPAASTGNRSPEPTPLSGFERDLQYVRNGGFKYVWVFSRKDGKRLDKNDGDYLRKNAPQVVDLATTDGKKAVAGSNFDLEPGNLELLKKRFVVEDYSGK
ncbi:MAG TPA: hypothetical protein VN920_12370 [Pyrinomonadaceae bacterium]|nr:hypothetical protein [Pyrinomonadaceae bacterium]